jgi:hypothetical protein
MKTEIVTPNNQYGIEKIMLNSETHTLELFLKGREEDPTGKLFAMDLLAQRKMATSFMKYERDSFTIKLPESNYIVMHGDINDVVDMLKTAEVIDKATVIKLENLVLPNIKESNSGQVEETLRVTSFFASKREGKGVAVKEEESVASQEKESKVISFFNSLNYEGKENIRELLKLLEDLALQEKEDVLRKLASESKMPDIKM